MRLGGCREEELGCRMVGGLEDWGGGALGFGLIWGSPGARLRGRERGLLLLGVPLLKGLEACLVRKASFWRGSLQAGSGVLGLPGGARLHLSPKWAWNWGETDRVSCLFLATFMPEPGWASLLDSSGPPGRI